MWFVPRLQYAAGAVDLNVTQRALRYLHFPGEAVILLRRGTSLQWLQHAHKKHCSPAAATLMRWPSTKTLALFVLSILMITKGNEDPRFEDKSLCLVKFTSGQSPRCALQSCCNTRLQSYRLMFILVTQWKIIPFRTGDRKVSLSQAHGERTPPHGQKITPTIYSFVDFWTGVEPNIVLI